MQRQLPISLQRWIFVQSDELRKLALTPPNSAFRTEDSIATVIARYIKVLPSLQNPQEYKILLENFKKCLSANWITIKKKYSVQAELIKNLGHIPLELWPMVFSLCGFLPKANTSSKSLSKENLSERLFEWLNSSPKQWFSTILLTIIEKCFDSDGTATLYHQNILSILSLLKK